MRFFFILTRKPIRDLTIRKCFKKTLTILLGINLFNFKQFLIINKRSTTLYRIFDKKFFKLQTTRKPIRVLSKNLGYQYMHTYVIDYNILDFLADLKQLLRSSSSSLTTSIRRGRRSQKETA